MIMDNKHEELSIEAINLAETQVLGSLLILGVTDEYEEALKTVSSIISPEDFLDSSFQDNHFSKIFRAMVETGKTDQVSITEYLAESGNLKSQTKEILIRLIEETPVAFDYEYYAVKVSEFASLRKNGHTPVDKLILDIAGRSEERTLTDLGNAERLIGQYGNNIRYCYERNSWLVFNGKNWDWDNGDKIKEMAKRTARNIYMEAAYEEDPKKRDELSKHAKLSEGNIRIKSMIELSQSSVPITMSELNRDHFLLNVNNGTINLRTGELQPHNLKDYITFLINIDFDPDATSELWDDFLLKIFENNANLIKYIQKSLGYSITGNQDEQSLWFFCGAGANGKTTLTGAIRDILGDYAIEIDPLAFATDKNSRAGPNESIASLYNKRFAASTEVKTGMSLDVALIKRMTGGEQLRCERKFEHGFNFLPTHKLFLSGNHEPRINDTTNSIWNRLKYIRFNVSIPEEERLRGLRHTFSKDHGAAILAWLVKGCLLWLEEGLIEPKEVKGAVQSYRDSQDILHDFLEEFCIVEPGDSILCKDFYAQYKKWADENDVDKPIGKQNFNGRLKEKGLKMETGHGNKQYWRGIRLKTDDEMVNLYSSVKPFSQSSIEYSSRIGTSEKTLNIFNQNNPLYPSENCPKCGKDEWGMKPDCTGYYCTVCENINE